MSGRVLISMLLMVVFIISACGPSLHSNKWTEREEAVRRLGPEDQADLADVALREPVASIREAAVEKLTDPAVLERVALTDSRPEVRTKAVKKLSDQAALARVAIGNGGSSVGEAAVARITDPKALERVALEGTGMNAPVAAARRLPEPLDPARGARLALEAKDRSIRQFAAARVNDQAVLAKVALNDRDAEPRRIAAARLTDQAVLAQLALGDKDNDVREAALPRVTDQAVLAKVALTDKNAKLRQVAAGQLKDQELLGQVVLTSKDGGTALAAVGNLTDQDVLMKVAAGTSNDRVLEQALARLRPESKQKIAETFYRKAKEENTEAAYSKFINRFPGTPQAKAASDMIQRKRFETLTAADTCASYAAYLVQYPSGPYSAEARRKLAAKGKWEKSKRLGELAIDMLPLYVSVPMMDKGYVSSPLAKSALDEFRVMLEAGADPKAVRISGTPVLVMRGQGRFVNGVGFVFGRYEGATMVPADQPGTPLVQFLEAHKLKEALQLIKSRETKPKPKRR